MDLGKFPNVSIICKSNHFKTFLSYFPSSNTDIRVSSQIKDLNFFSCVLKGACLTDVLTVKNSNVEAFIREAAEQSICPDTEMVCCHDLNKKEIPDETDVEKDVITDDYNPEVEICSEYESEGYR